MKTKKKNEKWSHCVRGRFYFSFKTKTAIFNDDIVFFWKNSDRGQFFLNVISLI